MNTCKNRDNFLNSILPKVILRDLSKLTVHVDQSGQVRFSWFISII